MIIEALDVPWVVLLSMDSFYKVRPCSAPECPLPLPPPLQMQAFGSWAPACCPGARGQRSSVAFLTGADAAAAGAGCPQRLQL